MSGDIVLRTVRRPIGEAEDPQAGTTDHRRLQAFFDHALDGILITDNDGRYVDANHAACEILGCSREDLLGRAPWEVTPEGDAAAARAAWDEFIRVGEMRGTIQLKRPSGAIRDVSYAARASVLPGLHMSIIRDVTDQRRLEQQLRGAQRMEAVGRLAGGIAHDFNNLLTVILGFSSEVLENYPDDPQLQFLIGEVKRAGERAAEMTRQLLAFSRRQVLQPRRFDVNETVQAMNAMLQRLIGEDIHYDVRPHTGPLIVEADPGQMEQVVTNLVVNARDAMPGGGRLTITTRPCTDPQSATVSIAPGDYAELCVIDTGAGIHPDHASSIFEPFFTTKASGKGTGLGLATVYGIIKQAGGYITVESEPGRGATFRVLLPLKTADAADACAPAALKEHGVTAGKRVLLVEDEPQVRHVAERLLARAGFVTVTAASPAEALTLLQTSPSFDAILSDVVMPDMSGVELAARARELVPGLPVVLMSGYSPEHAALLGQWLHEGPLVSKPLELGPLVEALSRAIERSPFPRP